MSFFSYWIRKVTTHLCWMFNKDSIRPKSSLTSCSGATCYRLSLIKLRLITYKQMFCLQYIVNNNLLWFFHGCFGLFTVCRLCFGSSGFKPSQLPTAVAQSYVYASTMTNRFTVGSLPSCLVTGHLALINDLV